MRSDDQAFLLQIEQYDRLVFSPVGDSMFPMLRGARDVVVLGRRPSGRLKRRDVALYRADSGVYVLHRVISILPNGYGFCGDNSLETDPFVSEERVLAVVKGFYRGKLHISVYNPVYRIYTLIWCSGMGARGVMLRFFRALRTAKARLRGGNKRA